MTIFGTERGRGGRAGQTAVLEMVWVKMLITRLVFQISVVTFILSPVAIGILHLPSPIVSTI